MITAIYPGTFDPITKGHIDIIHRAARLFNKIIVAIADSRDKSPLFSLDERQSLAQSVLAEIHNIEIIPFNGLATDFADQQAAKVIIRGIRAVSDFDYEFQMAGMNRQLNMDIETVFLTPSQELSYISANLVRTIASFNGDVSQFVPPVVVSALKAKFS